MAKFIPKKIYDIPEQLGVSPKLYRGCGTGFVVVDPNTHKVVSMGYGNIDGHQSKQNIMWGGQIDDDFKRGVILKESDKGIYISADFACYQAYCG